MRLDFDDLHDGFTAGGARVWTGDLDRVFISLASIGYDGTDTPLPVAVETWIELSGLACDGPGSTIAIGDAFLPEHGAGIASGYDDSYHLTPARLVRSWQALGYRGLVNHYVGMSHHPALRWDAGAGRYLVDAAKPLCAPARAWHRALADAVRAADGGLIWSVSFELFAANAPENWKQRDVDGAPALTGWQPPSTLLSPCAVDAMTWLRSVMAAFAGIARDAGLAVDVQVGEPWWWVGSDGRPCFYDAATRATYLAETGKAAPSMRDVAGARSPAERAFLDWAGGKLAAATGAVAAAAGAGASRRLLFYAPQVLDAAKPDLRRANMPAGWAYPAWDFLQLEEYSFIERDDQAGQAAAVAAVTQSLGYSAARQEYLSGFVLSAGDARRLWPRIVDAAERARRRGVNGVFVWAWPQIARDGCALFRIGEDEDTMAFHDVSFPLALGFGASGGPSFSTQVVTTASGHEQRNSAWADARLRFDAGLGVRSEADLAALTAFFRARRGPAFAFRFRDPLDFGSGAFGQPPRATDQRIGTGDGLRTRFDLIKWYDDQARRITRPVAGSVRIAVGGAEQPTGWRIVDGGAVAFDTAPATGAVVSAGFLFDVPVRFGEDRLDVSSSNWSAGEAPSVPLIEVREA